MKEFGAEVRSVKAVRIVMISGAYMNDSAVRSNPKEVFSVTFVVVFPLGFSFF